ncbi:MAG: uroporphyrinogen-III decarboxylase-like protein [Planctomycetes bacterium]|nr:uroporphyrinogen-III decarboxylase-like protein [Planctomycetota bacterium]
MTEKQRIKKCIHFEKTDIVPWQINYTTELADTIMKSLGLKEQSHIVLGRNVYRYNLLNDFLGNHITYLRNRPVDSYREVSTGIWKDEWGVLWDRRIDRDIGTPANCMLESGTTDNLKVPDPNDPKRYLHFQPLIEANPNRYILVKLSYSLFERAWSLRGMENLLVDMIQEPSFVHELFNLITDFNLAIMKNLTSFPIDGIYFGDDWGSQKSLLMNPDMWRTFIKPYLRKMYDQAHNQGYDVFIHSCGEISAVLEDLTEIGLNVFNPFQPEVMDIENIMRKFSGKLAFYGSLSIQKTLPFGNREDVLEEVQHRLRLARLHGGLIISPSHDLPPDTPLDNILTMLETIKRQSIVSTRGIV